MTINEINNLTVESCLEELIKRLVDTSSIPVDEEIVTLDVDTELDLYDRIIMHEDLEKPSFGDLDAELALYKIDLITIEEANAEQARREDLTSRIKTMLDRDAGFPAFHQVVEDTPNHAVFLRDLVNGNATAEEAESIVSQIEAQDAIIVATLNSNEYKDQRKELYWDIGDQLDAIFKMAVSLRDSGIDLGEDGDAWVNYIVIVKDSIPKP